MTWSSFVHLSTVWSMRGSSCTHGEVGVNIHSVRVRPQAGLAPRRDDVTDSTRAESLGTDAGSGPEQSLLSRRRRVYAPVVLHGRTRRQARTGYARAVRVCAAAARRRERAARSAKGAGNSHPRDVVDVVGVIADDGHHDGIGHLLHAAADDLDRAHIGASSFSAARFVRTAGCA